MKFLVIFVYVHKETNTLVPTDLLLSILHSLYTKVGWHNWMGNRRSKFGEPDVCATTRKASDLERWKFE